MEMAIVIEKKYKAPIEKVWQAITDKDQMKQWYFDLNAFKPEVGFEFKFSGQGLKGQEYLHLCKVTEVIIFKKLAYSWCYEGYEGISYVNFELFAEEDHTRLRLTHEGLESFPADNTDFATANFQQGWTEIIGSSLKQYVEN